MDLTLVMMAVRSWVNSPVDLMLRPFSWRYRVIVIRLVSLSLKMVLVDIL